MSTERSVPDACPGIVAVHQAEDGGLVRIRLPGGVLTAEQLSSLADAAVEFGDGNLDLTSRANLQIRGLRAGTAEALSQRLDDAGLLPSIRHDRVRNIVASPLSGLDERSVYDVLPLAVELDRRLCATDRLAELPGRFLFALDDGRGDVASLEPDAGLRIVGPASGVLLLGGADTGFRVHPDDAVDVLIAAAEAFLTERSRHDATAWRVAELPDPVARILPHLPLPSQQPALESVEPGGPPRVGLHGRGIVVAAVPLGRLTQDQARLVAELGEEIRITPWRSVVVRVSGDGESAMERGGLVVDPASGWVGVSACTGRPGCGKALADVRADAVRVVGMTGSRRAVHWSGCERRCGRPKGEVVDVVATGNGYQVDGTAVPTVDEIAALLTTGEG